MKECLSKENTNISWSDLKGKMGSYNNKIEWKTFVQDIDIYVSEKAKTRNKMFIGPL